MGASYIFGFTLGGCKMHHNEMVTTQHTINWFVCMQHSDRYIQFIETEDCGVFRKRHKVTADAWIHSVIRWNSLT